MGANGPPRTIVDPFPALKVLFVFDRVGRKLDRPQMLWGATTAWILALNGAASIRFNACGARESKLDRGSMLRARFESYVFRVLLQHAMLCGEIPKGLKGFKNAVAAPPTERIRPLSKPIEPLRAQTVQFLTYQICHSAVTPFADAQAACCSHLEMPKW